MSAIASSGNALRFLDPTDARTRAAWDEFVKASPAGTIFHTTGWMDVIQKGIGLMPRFAYVPGPQRSIRALVPLFRAGGLLRQVRWLNVPQSCPSDPIFREEADAQLLLERVASAAATEGARAVVLRAAREFRPALRDGWEIRRESPVLRHRLTLAGVTDLESLPRARYNRRQNFRKLRQTLPNRGIRLHQIRAGETIAFARVLHRILLHSHGHLGLPARFFEALLDVLPAAARLTVVGSVKDPGLGFTLCLWSPPSCYLLYGGGMPTKEGSEAYRWGLGEEIEAAIRANLESFDFGETGPQQQGLIFHKEGWGAELVDGSYLVLGRQPAYSGLRVLGKDLSWAAPFVRWIPVGLSLKIARPIHRSLQ